ncbi:hypothetical protein ACHAXT_004781 [Thalassiosira profunda]
MVVSQQRRLVGVVVEQLVRRLVAFQHKQVLQVLVLSEQLERLQVLQVLVLSKQLELFSQPKQQELEGRLEDATLCPLPMNNIPRDV